VPKPLPRAFYERDAVLVARELLGCILTRRAGHAILRGRIVETEAYCGEADLACHARAGRTPRTEVMYGPAGLAYVYFTYGMHHCLNAVTGPVGTPSAVLIRAVEPLEGIERMTRARGTDAAHRLASGPARLCEAFGIDLRQNRADLGGPDLWIEPGDGVPDGAVSTSPRIGCERVPAPWNAVPWRFFVGASPHVSPGGSRTALPRRPGIAAAPPKRAGNRAPHRK
jgi:DNA-3-methyladenine glycosylase